MPAELRPPEVGNLATIIARLADRDPDAPCIEQDGTCYSRADVMQSARELCGFFQAQGIVAGNAVAIVAVDQLKGIQAAIALWVLDAAVLFLDPRQSVTELNTAQSRAGVDAVFTDSKSFARRGDFGLLPPHDPSAAPEIGWPIPPVSCDNDALIMSSSGTTGLPRFRRVSHRGFIDGMSAAARLLDVPVPHKAATVGSLAFGAILSQWIKLLVHGQFNLSLPLVFKLADLDQVLRRKDIHFVGLPPVVIRDLLRFQSENHVSCDGPAYPNLKRMASVGGPISPDDLVQAYQRLTPHIKNIYSMTHVGAVSVLSGDAILSKSGSVGKPFAGVTVRIETETKDLCPPGQVGRIVAQPNWKAGATAIDTGDLGWIDADGYLFVKGRSDQIATRNSINISMLDIEQDVKKIAGVRDCIAFSAHASDAPDDVVFLAVETQAEAALIRAQIKSSLASYRRPDQIMIRPVLPRNAAQKISLRALKEMTANKETGFVDF